MQGYDVPGMVDRLLEGEDLHSVLSTPQELALKGKTLLNYPCSACDGQQAEIVEAIEDKDGSTTLTVKCTSCGDVVELQTEGEIAHVMSCDEGVSFDSNLYFPITEGLMVGNYLKFNSSVSVFIFMNEKKEYTIGFGEQPAGSKVMNTRVIFKVLSFKNGQAKLISMVKDSVNKIPEGTIFYADNKDLQRYAKMAKPRQSSSMKGRFKY